MLRRSLRDLEGDLGVLGDHQRAAGQGALDGEGPGPAAEEGRVEVVAQHQRRPGEQVAQVRDLGLGRGGQLQAHCLASWNRERPHGAAFAIHQVEEQGL